MKNFSFLRTDFNTTVEVGIRSSVNLQDRLIQLQGNLLTDKYSFNLNDSEKVVIIKVTTDHTTKSEKIFLK